MWRCGGSTGIAPTFSGGGAGQRTRRWACSRARAGHHGFAGSTSLPSAGPGRTVCCCHVPPGDPAPGVPGARSCCPRSIFWCRRPHQRSAYRLSAGRIWGCHCVSARDPLTRSRGEGGRAVHRRRRGVPLDPSPPPPPLPMFEADSRTAASAPSVPRGLKLKIFWPAFGRDHRGGGGSQPNRPPPSDPPSPPLFVKGTSGLYMATDEQLIYVMWY